MKYFIELAVIFCMSASFLFLSLFLLSNCGTREDIEVFKICIQMCNGKVKTVNHNMCECR